MPDKFLDVKPGTALPRERTPISTSAGAGDAGKIFVTDANGKIDPSFTYGSSIKSLPVSEAILARAAINVFGGEVRNAVATGVATKCEGFALEAQPTIGQNVRIVLDDQSLSGFSGLTPDAEYFLDPTTPGAITSTPPTTATQIAQRVGKAESATVLNIDIDQPIERG